MEAVCKAWRLDGHSAVPVDIELSKELFDLTSDAGMA
jgi:hypothetical protein